MTGSGILHSLSAAGCRRLRRTTGLEKIVLVGSAAEVGSLPEMGDLATLQLSFQGHRNFIVSSTSDSDQH